MTETEFAPIDSTPTPPPAPRRVRRRVGLATVGAFAVAAGAVIGVNQATQSTPPAGSTATSQPATFIPGDRRGGFGSVYDGTDASSGSTSSATTTEATRAQQVGIVEIDTALAYQNAQSAGTGIVLTSSGEVLTNNHVVQGSTSISVTISSTGATYTARVVGTDPTDDVAVLQLTGASGLQTARLSTAAATVGEAVTGVGNAGGTGTLTAASGTITALDQTITASDESGSNAEQLSGLIQTDAAIQAGDSGGPLYGSSGAVIGMDTAASSGGAPQGYAIPIAAAEVVAAQIVSGVDDATIHQGYPAFLGVSLQDGGAGASVAATVSGGPAESAGIVAGDVITAVGSKSITSAQDLSSAMAGYAAGDRVSVTWTTATGAPQSATVTLASGPAD